MGTLIFVFSIICGVGVFIYTKQSEQKQWRISGEKEVKKKQFENYYSLRIQDPVSEEIINLATSLREYNSHQKWLKEIVHVLEENYKINNLDIFDVNGLKLPEKHSEINDVINKEGNYEKICKYIQRKPIEELLEDLNKNISYINNNNVKIEQHNSEFVENEQLYILKDNVINLLKKEKDRAEIIKIIKNENKDKKDFKIWCENKIWYINYLIDDNLQEIKFKNF
tara:strand:+ start:197 stop:871 length:675 start_codon:yes stop_codon:yes gene_type:complete